MFVIFNMGKINLDELPVVDMVLNPGKPIVQLSDGRLIVHDRDTQEWVLSNGYSCARNFSIDPISGKMRSNYGTIERVCDYLEFVMLFGTGSLLRQGL